MEVPDNQFFDLRQQAGYWRAQHALAAKRASGWKGKAQEIEEMVKALKTSLVESAKEKEDLEARIAWLERQVFGAKGEESKEDGAGSRQDAPSDGASAKKGARRGARKRGQQRGKKSAGRRCHPEPPAEEILHDIPERERCCPNCALPFDVFPGAEDSEEIHWEVRAMRKVHRRKRYRRTCKCPDAPGIVTAPLPPKLLPKGKFTMEFWVRILEQKYRFRIPSHRTLKMLEAEGARLAQGAIADGLQRIGELVQPLYARILEHSRGAGHWHMDETRWQVFEEVEGKRGAIAGGCG